MVTMPRLCFVGPMLGPKDGRAPTQAETLVGLFRGEGVDVFSTSAEPARLRRLADISATLVRRRRDMDVQMLQVFGGRSFVVEDVASAIAKASGVPIVMTLRGGAMPEFVRRYPRWTRRVLGRAAAIVAPSAFLARELAGLGLPLHVIPNVIRTECYAFIPRRSLRPRLLWMRAFQETYDPHMAVRVLAEVRTTYPDATMTMAGPDMGLRASTEALARQLGLAEAVAFPGFLDAHGKARAGAEHDVYLNTNRVDNMPVSVIEMGAMGVPVVATRVGGIPDLVRDGESALLVDPGDVKAMAAAVSRLLGAPDLAARLSHAGHELAMSCSWARVFPMWVDLLTKVR